MYCISNHQRVEGAISYKHCHKKLIQMAYLNVISVFVLFEVYEVVYVNRFILPNM